MTDRPLARDSAVVAAPPAEVYELIAHPRHRVRWLPELDATDAPDRELVEGDRFQGYSSLLLHRFVGASDVTAAEPGRVLEEHVVIGARMTTRWELTERPDGTTEVTHVLDVEFPKGPLGRVARWVMRWRIAKLQRDGLKRLQQACPPR